MQSTRSLLAVDVFVTGDTRRYDLAGMKRHREVCAVVVFREHHLQQFKKLIQHRVPFGLNDKGANKKLEQETRLDLSRKAKHVPLQGANGKVLGHHLAVLDVQPRPEVSRLRTTYRYRLACTPIRPSSRHSH